MVSPGTHLVENHESHSRTIEFQYKTKWVLGSFVTTQLIWSQTPELCTTVYWSKINFFYCKAQKRVKEISIVYKQPKEQPQKFTQTGYSTKTSSDRLIVLCVHGMHTTKYWASWGFLCLRDAGRRGNKITVRGKLIWVWLVYIWCITKGLGLRISPGRLLWAWWLTIFTGNRRKIKLSNLVSPCNSSPSYCIWYTQQLEILVTLWLK